MVKIAKEKFDISQHILVPKHTKLSEKERDKVLESYKITLNDLPKISMTDPAVAHMDLTTDDLIKIERESQTSKNTVFYRRVVK